MTGYDRDPALSAHHVAFVREDALWVAEPSGANPRRLTVEGAVRHPRFSADGRQLAFAWNVEGQEQVYRVAVEGGRPERLTWEPTPTFPVAARGDRVVVRSGREAPLLGWSELFELDLAGGVPRRLPVGPARAIDFAPDGDRVVIGRHRQELAHWKRYRGGTVPVVWIGSLGRGEFERLLGDEDAGQADPRFVDERVYFLSDRDGIGNLWSCDVAGGDLRQHTFGRELYARALAGHGRTLVFTRGGQLFLYDVERDEERALAVDLPAAGVQLTRKFARAPRDLQELELAPDARQLAATVRGKALVMEAWGVGARQLGRPSGVRYRLPRFLAPSAEARAAGTGPARATELVLLSDEGGEERLELFDVATGARADVFELVPHGIRRTVELVPHPTARRLLLLDVSGGVFVVDLERPAADDSEPQPALRTLARSRQAPVREACWSGDGAYVVWIEPVSPLLAGGRAHLVDVEAGTDHVLNDDELLVHAPTFDPLGRFLFVLSERTFDPVLDLTRFAATNADATRPYAFVLRKGQLSPFDPRWPDVLEAEEKALEKELDALAEDEAERRRRAPRPVSIDVDGLAERVVELPDVPPGRYRELRAAKGAVTFVELSPIGLRTEDTSVDGEEHLGQLVHVELATGKRTHVLADVCEHRVVGGRTLVRQRDAAWLLKTGEEPPDDAPREGKNRGTGELDLGRLSARIEPRDEWAQMYHEAWRMLRDHFWTADFAGVDWDAMRARYLPVLERVTTRAELSDLIWELAGELGTSHAYEWGGDHPPTRDCSTGALGARFAWERGDPGPQGDGGSGGWRIERLLRGDPWRREASCPLTAPGAGLEPGDLVVAVDGQRLDERTEPGAALDGRAGAWCELRVRPASGAEERSVFVRALETEDALGYRDWVRRNRERTDELSGGRLGYLHLPDMGGVGLSEFFRSFRAQSKRLGLVVDVRHNGGGFVSSLILDSLRRTLLGWDRPRYGEPQSYPDDVVRGPMACLCDEHTGSDGDLFCQAWKTWELGPLIGKRTWGGLVGIDPNGALADGTVVTQPEFAFCFGDVGWDVENRGVDPDVEVEWDPAAWAAGRDPQLEKAVAVLLAELERRPVEGPVWPPVPSRRIGD